MIPYDGKPHNRGVGRRALGTALCACLLAMLITWPAADGSAQQQSRHGLAGNAAANGAPLRIVSLAPSITEILFALGAGGNVVGVTTYAKYPPGARLKTKIGGFINPNYEVIAALKPTIVFMLPIHHEHIAKLSRLGIRSVVTNNDTIADIHNAILKIGETIGKTLEAKELVSRLRSEERAIITRYKSERRPGVMIVVSRQRGTLRSVFVAGGDTIFNDLVQKAGGRNVFSDSKTAYPIASPEQIAHKNPDIIIQLEMGTLLDERSKAMLLNDWRPLSIISAVRNRRVYLVNTDYASVPGPRYILLLKKFAAFIHPEEAER